MEWGRCPGPGPQGLPGKGGVQGHGRDHQHQQGHVGQQQALRAEAHRLLAAHHAGQGIGQRPQPPAEAVGHVDSGGDELHRHGVQQRIGVQLQDAQGQKDHRRAPEAGAGGIEHPVDPQGQHQADVQQALDGHLRMAVRPAAQQGLGQDARKAPDGGEHARLSAGEAPAQQQGRLIAAYGEHCRAGGRMRGGRRSHVQGVHF